MKCMELSEYYVIIIYPSYFLGYKRNSWNDWPSRTSRTQGNLNSFHLIPFIYLCERIFSADFSVWFSHHFNC